MLRQDFQAAKAQIQALGYVIPGSVQKRLYSCGKPNCRCVTQGILHGPYYQWTRKISGKTVNITLDPQSAKTVKEWIQNNRKLRKICHRRRRLPWQSCRPTRVWAKSNLSLSCLS
jgi:hypothetical protein